MNFFEDQREAHRKTRNLLFWFFITVALVAVGTGILLAYVLSFGTTLAGESRPVFEVWHIFASSKLQLVILAVSLFTFLTIIIISWFKTSSLKSKPEKICLAMGASPVGEGKYDHKKQQYVNIVEEMSIASGVPVPKIYILQDEAINAFACGYDINSSAICITTGCLYSLNRDELQAVIAHEFSHILNGDMTINLKLIGMLAGLVFIHQGGYFLFRVGARSGGRRNGKEGSAIAGVGLGLMAVGIVGSFVGSCLKAAISRQREFLADASSVQFTRNPEGISGALKKIFVSSSKGIVQSSEAMEASHMFLVEGILPGFFSLATHPDLMDRIRAVEKNFNEKRFLDEEAPVLLDKIYQEKKSRFQSKKEKKEKVDAKKDYLIPLYILFSNRPAIKSNQDYLIAFMQESKNLSFQQKEKLLQQTAGFIANLKSDEKQKLEISLREEINKDGKIDFDEFLIYAYLRPSLKDIKIEPKRLSKERFEKYSLMMRSYFSYLDPDNQIDFEPVPKSQIKYSLLLKIIDELRFTSLEQKKTLLEDLKKIASSNSTITHEEGVLIRLLAQLFSIPGEAI